LVVQVRSFIAWRQIAADVGGPVISAFGLLLFSFVPNK
jgi:hypothetical protein